MKHSIRKTLMMTALLAVGSGVPATAQQLPGEYAIRTMLKNTYLTARPNSPRLDPIITSAMAPGPNEKFRLERMQPSYTLFRTSSHHFVSALRGGGLGAGYDPGQVLVTTPNAPTDEALFRLQSYSPGSLNYAIRTFKSYFVTALGGGGKSSAAFHTNATKANAWEGYRITKCGDLGSGHDYAIFSTGNTTSPIRTIGTTVGVSGALASPRFKFDGASGVYTLRQASRTQAAGKFTFMEAGSCTYTIRTANGFYVGTNAAGLISTTVAFPSTGTGRGFNTYFELVPFI